MTEEPKPKRQLQITYVDTNSESIFLVGVPDIIADLQESACFLTMTCRNGIWDARVNPLYDLNEVVQWVESMA